MARVLVFQHAAEGLAVARSSPYLTEADLAIARDELLAMTEDNPDEDGAPGSGVR